MKLAWPASDAMHRELLMNDVSYLRRSFLAILALVLCGLSSAFAEEEAVLRVAVAAPMSG